MTDKIKIADLPRFDAAEHLDSEEAIAEYLAVVLEENDTAALVKALGTVARARGMTQIAKDAGMGRESLYKSLSGSASPRFDTINRVCQALGVRLVAVPMAHVRSNPASARAWPPKRSSGHWHELRLVPSPGQVADQQRPRQIHQA